MTKYGVCGTLQMSILLMILDTVMHLALCKRHWVCKCGQTCQQINQ